MPIVKHIKIGEQKIDIAGGLEYNWLYDKNIVVYGDSTAAIDVSYINQLPQVYPYVNITNRAIGGSTMSTTTTDPQNGYALIKNATDLTNFDMLFLCYGTNDWATGTALYGNTPGTWFGALRDTIKNALSKNPSLYIVAFLPLYSTTEKTIPEKNALGMTVRDYAETAEKLCAYLGIPVYNLNKISGSGIYNYSTMMQAELNTTYVHELAPLGKRIAEYVVNTPPQAYSAELKWSKCPQIAHPNDIGALSTAGVPNRFIGPNNFTVNTTATVPMTWIENQIYSIHGYTTGPVTISVDGITTYRIQWAGEFNFTFITGSATTNPLTFTSTDSIIIAGLEIGTNSSQDLYTNAFYFMRPFSNLQNVTARADTPSFVPGARLTDKGLENKLSGFTSTAAIAQNAVICSLPFTIPGTCMFPAYNMTDGTPFVIGAYQGGNIWTLSAIPANKQFFILPGIYPFR